MANVRIDENGVAKGVVFEHTAPAVHRSNVTAVDGSDPASSAGVDTAGFEAVDFDLDVTLGGTDPLVEVAPIYFDATADAWFKGESAFFNSSGRFRVRAEGRGAVTYLKVVALTGTSPTLDLDAWASLT
ncbi:MAG: hypothetical protein R3C39_03900 [Dehalococcoidia bacterium]